MPKRRIELGIAVERAIGDIGRADRRPHIVDRSFYGDTEFNPITGLGLDEGDLADLTRD